MIADEIARLIELSLGRYQPDATRLINQISGEQIAPATSGGSGAMSADDKAKLDSYPDVAGLTAGHVLTAIDADTIAFSALPGGSVTSVGLVMPGAIFDVSGSPITSSGDITVTLDNQSANRVLAGPTTGSPAAPTFRALVAADLPTHTQAWSTITGTPTTLSGYGITDAQPLDSDLTAIAALSTTTFGRSLLTQADAAATRATIGAGTGNGTVTSVFFAAPSMFDVTGSPVTSAGTIDMTLGIQSANRVFAGPTTGAAATPTWRALVAADLPTLSSLSIINDGSSGSIEITSYRNSAFLSRMLFYGARGSLASPSAVQAGDIIGRFGAIGYHSGGAFGTGETVAVQLIAEENWTSSAQGTRARFQTTSTGSTSPTNAMDVLPGGGVELFERTDAAAGAANSARLYARDNGAGKTQLVVRFNTGAIQVIAIQP